MEKVQSLAEFLGTAPPTQADAPEVPLVDVKDPKAFAEAVIASREFRNYIINSLSLGSLPAAVTMRLMDYAWGKPPERVELTGKDGAPIEHTYTRIERVVVDAPRRTIADLALGVSADHVDVPPSGYQKH